MMMAKNFAGDKETEVPLNQASMLGEIEKWKGPQGDWEEESQMNG
jgi:hypothetical protein